MFKESECATVKSIAQFYVRSFQYIKTILTNVLLSLQNIIQVFFRYKLIVVDQLSIVNLIMSDNNHAIKGIMDKTMNEGMLDNFYLFLLCFIEFVI